MDLKTISVHSGRIQAQRMFPVTSPCERCGADKTERHHKDGNTRNNVKSNISFLCRKCHMIEDGRLATLALSAAKRIAETTESAAVAKRNRTHCKRGHLLSGDNMHINSNGSRVCHECKIIVADEYKRRIKK